MPYLNDVHNYTIFLIGVHDTYVQNSKNEECHIHITHELHANPSFFFMFCRRQKSGVSKPIKFFVGGWGLDRLLCSG